MSFKIFTDSTCDIHKEDLIAWDVTVIKPILYFTDREDEKYCDGDFTSKEFYDEMRKGRLARTAGLNMQDYSDAFEEELRKGNDVLHLGFSSACSSTYSCSQMAAEDLSEKYPDRKVLTVDTLSQSAGQGMLLKMAVDRRDAGQSIEEVKEFLEEEKRKIAHWFLVDDLQYLKRNGRLSSASAVIATVLNIKPILHTDNDGSLVAVEKIRGRKQAIKRMIDIYGEKAIHPNEGPVYLNHADCLEDVKFMEELLYKEYGVKAEYIADIGPVIGSHVGPGTMSIFYEAKER